MSGPIASQPRDGVVAELITYPIKGCAGTAVSRTTMTPAGLAYDRSFMVINPDGEFRSQRGNPRLALIRPDISADGMRLSLRAPGTDAIHVAVDLDARRRDVLLFGTRYQGIDQGDAVAGWLSQVLAAPSRLVRVPPEHHRITDGQTRGTSGYADGCAVHVLSRSSLDLLNERLRERGAPALPMSRFRPNIVIARWASPHTEDRVRRVTVRDVELRFAKLAIRCVVTTVDQDSGAKTGPEPLRTLATYRRHPDGVAFGANFAVTGPGELAVGDQVTVSHWDGLEPAPDGFEVGPGVDPTQQSATRF